MKKLIVAIALLTASPAMARHDYADVGSWKIVNNDDGTCGMIGGFDANTYLHITYNQRLEKTRLTFVDAAYASLKTGDVKTLELEFINGAGKVDTGWGSTKYEAAALENNSRMLTAWYKGAQMLEDLRHNSVMALLYKDTVVESLNLKGIAPAVDSLEKCATAEAKTHPIDIFAAE